MTIEELEKKEEERDKKDTSRKIRREAFIKAMKSQMDRITYVQPDLFNVLVGLNIAIRLKSEDWLKSEDYAVWTKYPHTDGKAPKQIIVSKENGLAIKQLIKNKSQFMFLKSDTPPFDVKASILTINSISIPIKRYSTRYSLCELFFGDMKDLTKIWELEEVITRISEDPYNKDRVYKILYPKIRHLNEKIEKETGLEDVIVENNRTYSINPLYTNILPKRATLRN